MQDIPGSAPRLSRGLQFIQQVLNGFRRDRHLSHSGAVPDNMNKAQPFQDRISFSGPLSLYHKGRWTLQSSSEQGGREKLGRCYGYDSCAGGRLWVPDPDRDPRR
jgi:hypothetical protein